MVRQRLGSGDGRWTLGRTRAAGPSIVSPRAATRYCRPRRAGHRGGVGLVSAGCGTARQQCQLRPERVIHAPNRRVIGRCGGECQRGDGDTGNPLVSRATAVAGGQYLSQLSNHLGSRDRLQVRVKQALNRRSKRKQPNGSSAWVLGPSSGPAAGPRSHGQLAWTWPQVAQSGERKALWRGCLCST
jgi:hypothetical protein